MKHPTDTLCESITGVDDTIEVGKEDVACFAPILNGKVLDFDVTRLFGRLVGINHFDGGLVVFIEEGGSILSKSELSQDGSKIFHWECETRDGSRCCHRWWGDRDRTWCDGTCVHLIKINAIEGSIKVKKVGIALDGELGGVVHDGLFKSMVKVVHSVNIVKSSSL
jgi:hypothetical protein